MTGCARIALLACLVVAASAACLAGEDYAQGVLERTAAIAACRAVSAKDYPNHGEVLVDTHGITRYREDGTSETFVDEYLKVLTEKSRRERSTLLIPYHRAYGDVELTLLEIIKADGTVAPIDMERHVKLQIRPPVANIYDRDAMQLKAGIPGLEVGDTVHYVQHSRRHKVQVPRQHTDLIELQRMYPLRRMRVTIIGPRSHPLRAIALSSEIEGCVTASQQDGDEEIRYDWTARGVPAFVAEPKMPPAYEARQQLLVGTIATWEEISRWYYALCEPALKATTPEMQAKVDELTHGLADPMDRIRAVFFWCSQKVRYAGITAESEAPTAEPHAVRMTFERRHGVCRDKAALCAAMMRLAGFEAYVVPVANGPRLEEKTPMMYFGHAITAIRNEDGTYLLMDSTATVTAQLLGTHLSGKNYLVATPQGDPLRVIPLERPEANMLRIETTARASADGSLRCTSVMTFEGCNNSAYRAFLVNASPQKRRGYFEQRLQESLPGARLQGMDILPRDLSDMNLPLVVTLDYASAGALIGPGAGRVAMCPLPVFADLGMASLMLGGLEQDTRRHPFIIGWISGVSETVNVQLDPALPGRMSLPTSQPIDTATHSYRRTTTQDGQSFTVQRELLLKTNRLSPEQYLELKRTVERMDLDRRQIPLLRRQ